MVGSLFTPRGPKLTADHLFMCSTILKSDHFQKRFSDKWVLIDGYSNDEVALAESYGFKKVISLMELLSLEIYASNWIGADL